MEIVIEPFRPEHIGLIEEFYSDEKALKELLRQRPEYPQLLFHGGPAFSGFEFDGTYLGSFGMVRYWEKVGKLWLILDKKVEKHKKTFHRLFKNRLDLWVSMYGMVRLCTDVSASDARAIRWIESFGFEREGLQKSYGPNLEDYFLYAKVTSWPG